MALAVVGVARPLLERPPKPRAGGRPPEATQPMTGPPASSAPGGPQGVGATHGKPGRTHNVILPRAESPHDGAWRPLGHLAPGGAHVAGPDRDREHRLRLPLALAARARVGQPQFRERAPSGPRPARPAETGPGLSGQRRSCPHAGVLLRVPRITTHLPPLCSDCSRHRGRRGSGGGTPRPRGTAPRAPPEAVERLRARRATPWLLG